MENNLISFACSVEGFSHKKSNKPCQDASTSEPSINSRGDVAHRFIAVADGHGGEPYFRSDAGSALAVSAARECMTDAALIDKLSRSGEITRKEHDDVISWLKKSILSRWNTLISEHGEANPFTEEELAPLPEKYADRYRNGEKIESAYGCTVIAVLLTDSFILAMQIGDGSCVFLDAGGSFSLPLPVDEKCFLNVTTSICDSNAISEFRHHYSESLPVAVIIATDGIDDSFGFNDPSASPDRLYDFYRVVLTSFAANQEETAIEELADYLPRLSEKGSGDDISIGVIADIESLKKVNLKREKELESIAEPSGTT